MLLPSPAQFQETFFRRHPGAHSVMSLFDALPHVAFYAKDLESRYVRVNQLSLQRHGVQSEEEMLGKTDRDFHPPALAEAYIAEDRRVLATARPIPGQVWLVFHERRMPHWYVSTKVPLWDTRGKVIGLAGAMYSIEQPAEQQRYFRELFPVIQHIEQHYAEPISMEAMAARARLSSTHFNRRFQQLLRMTPTGYLRTVRVQAARRLISTTNRTLAEIAREAGFTDQSHLTRCFREATGLTPRAYRLRSAPREQVNSRIVKARGGADR